MKLTIFAMALVPSLAFAGNFATCILKHMPGIQNDPAAHAAMRLCLNEYPGGYASVQQGEGRGFLSYDSGAECAVKNGAGTTSRMAGQQIFNACNKLFNEPVVDLSWEPNPFDKFDQQEKAPSSDSIQKEKQQRLSAPIEPSKTTQPASSLPTRTPYRKQVDRPVCNIKPVMTDAEIAACRYEHPVIKDELPAP